MLVVRDLSKSPWPGRRSVVTIGAYDGVHRGHQSVIAAVRDKAAADGALSTVVTFDRHPASVVRPESAPLLLTDLDQKLELLEATGVDAVVVVPFDESQASESPIEFIERVLVRCLAASHVAVGEDFHFGKNRAGDVTMLREQGARHGF
ncbi:MAG: bifunctional riboflavin kinase/FAD synthetase, partial [Acidobacteria bacterium]|nr:bifunctional riboflavin kinase/FAD synthetase [Acidobacteriota bacterium]